MSIGIQKDNINMGREPGSESLISEDLGLSFSKKKFHPSGIMRGGSNSKQTGNDVFGIQGRKLDYPKWNKYQLRENSEDSNQNRLPKV